MKRALMIIGGLVVLCGGGFFLLTTMGLLGMGKAIEEAKEAPGGARETAFAIGQEFAVGDLAYTVTEATMAGPTLQATDGFSGPITADGGGVFVVVRFTAKNNGKTSASISKPTLQDSQDRTFSHTTTFGAYVPEEEHCTLEVMNAGLSETCQDVYQVPADAAGLVARFSDGLGYKFVDLAISGAPAAP